MVRNWCASALMACCVSPAYAAPILPWQPFIYSTNGSSVADALTAMGRAVGVPVRFDGDVEGQLAGRYQMRADRFLDVMAASFDLIWYYDGAVVHVQPSGARKSVHLRLNYVSAGAVKALLENQGISDARMPLLVDARRNTLTVSGPASYTDRVADAVRRLEDEACARTETVVRAVPLHFETAADRRLVADGRTISATGLASRLSRRVHRVDGAEGAARWPGGTAPEWREFDAPLPVFEADARTNTILVRDRAGRLDADQALVERFDTKPEAMSIRAYVFDVKADSFDALGLSEASSGEGADARPEQALMHDGGVALLEQLHALVGAGKARACVERNLITVDHAPVAVECEEVIATAGPDANGSAQANAEQAPGAHGASVVIVPDLGELASAALFRLVTTVRERDGFGFASSSAAEQASRRGPWGTFDDTLAAGDALALYEPGAGASDAGDGWKRLVVVVPKPIVE